MTKSAKKINSVRESQFVVAHVTHSARFINEISIWRIIIDPKESGE